MIPDAAEQAATAALPAQLVVKQGAQLSPFLYFYFMNIVPASQNNFSAVINLLKENHLPTEEISEATKLFVVEEGNEARGAVGLEFSGVYGLLRSLVVSGSHRSSGYGNRLVDFIENFAIRQGVRQLYLLTTTADKFFARRGYNIIPREEVPQFIKQTSEFSSACPASALVMKKDLL